MHRKWAFFYQILNIFLIPNSFLTGSGSILFLPGSGSAFVMNFFQILNPDPYKWIQICTLPVSTSYGKTLITKLTHSETIIKNWSLEQHRVRRPWVQSWPSCQLCHEEGTGYGARHSSPYAPIKKRHLFVFQLSNFVQSWMEDRQSLIFKHIKVFIRCKLLILSVSTVVFMKRKKGPITSATLKSNLMSYISKVYKQ